MEKKNRRGLPCPGRPKKIKGSGLVSGRSGRRHLPPAAFLAARFAPRSPQSLAAPSRGAKSSQKFRAAACHRRPFQRRDLLPAPRKALRHRSGEQNLHTDSAPPPATGDLFSGAIAPRSPQTLAASSRGAKSSHRFRAVSCLRRLFQRRDLPPAPRKPLQLRLGSKIFTQIPRRRLPPAAFFSGAICSRPSRTLAAPSRGAKSSHRFRAAACHRRPFQRRDLLPAPRKALRLRPGEQNLHSNSAPPPATGDLFSGAICSPLPANPCSFVPGSKIFTSIPRRGFASGGFFSGAICSPPSAKACGFVPGSKIFTEIPRRRLPPGFYSGAICSPAPHKALRLRSGEQNLHRDSRA